MNQQIVDHLTKFSKIIGNNQENVQKFYEKLIEINSKQNLKLSKELYRQIAQKLFEFCNKSEKIKNLESSRYQLENEGKNELISQIINLPQIAQEEHELNKKKCNNLEEKLKKINRFIIRKTGEKEKLDMELKEMDDNIKFYEEQLPYSSEKIKIEKLIISQLEEKIAKREEEERNGLLLLDECLYREKTAQKVGEHDKNEVDSQLETYKSHFDDSLEMINRQKSDAKEYLMTYHMMEEKIQELDKDLGKQTHEMNSLDELEQNLTKQIRSIENDYLRKNEELRLINLKNENLTKTLRSTIEERNEKIKELEQHLNEVNRLLSETNVESEKEENKINFIELSKKKSQKILAKSETNIKDLMRNIGENKKLFDNETNKNKKQSSLLMTVEEKATKQRKECAREENDLDIINSSSEKRYKDEVKTLDELEKEFQNESKTELKLEEDFREKFQNVFKDEEKIVEVIHKLTEEKEELFKGNRLLKFEYDDFRQRILQNYDLLIEKSVIGRKEIEGKLDDIEKIKEAIMYSIQTLNSLNEDIENKLKEIDENVVIINESNVKLRKINLRLNNDNLQIISDDLRNIEVCYDRMHERLSFAENEKVKLRNDFQKYWKESCRRKIEQEEILKNLLNNNENLSNIFKKNYEQLFENSDRDHEMDDGFYKEYESKITAQRALYFDMQNKYKNQLEDQELTTTFYVGS
ncbi:hypothetical protein SNEBB_001993 [Seison nebaliae]|nr:hypothetical protein SNEBB_001993 [Seison nebaliae]